MPVVGLGHSKAPTSKASELPAADAQVQRPPPPQAVACPADIDGAWHTHRAACGVASAQADWLVVWAPAASVGGGGSEAALIDGAGRLQKGEVRRVGGRERCGATIAWDGMDMGSRTQAAVTVAAGGAGGSGTQPETHPAFAADGVAAASGGTGGAVAVAVAVVARVSSIAEFVAPAKEANRGGGRVCGWVLHGQWVGGVMVRGLPITRSGRSASRTWHGAAACLQVGGDAGQSSGTAHMPRETGRWRCSLRSVAEGRHTNRTNPRATHVFRQGSRLL